MIKAFIFDFVQTLGNAAEGYKEAEKSAQVKLFERFYNVLWDDFIGIYRNVRQNNFTRADLSRKKMWVETADSFGIKIEDAILDEMENEYWDTVKKSMKLFPETLDVLEALKKKYKTGLITNSQKDGSTRALDSDVFTRLEELMDVIVIAADGGIPAKPDPKPFMIALRKLEAKPEEAVFVGDDWRVDIEGSRNAGMTPVWLKHYSVKRNWPEKTFEVIEINDLNELLQIEKKLNNL